MTEVSTLQSAPLAEYYGDQEARLETLRSLDYDDFKRQLIEVHGGFIGAAEYRGFTTCQNSMSGGNNFPPPDKKDEVLAYALEQAQRQDDVQDAALIINIGIVCTHPFSNGNGRTGRTLYAGLSRGLKFDGSDGAYSDEAELLQTGGIIARDIIDIGGPLTERFGHWMDNLVYGTTGVEKIATQAWYLSQDEEAAKWHYGEREYHDLDADDAKKLDVLFGEKHGTDGKDPARYGTSMYASLYALSRIVQESGVDLPVQNFSGRSLVNIPDSLAQLNGLQKREVIEYIQEYNTLYAKAAIDLIAKHRDVRIEDPVTGLKTKTIKDMIVEKTNNYLVSDIGGTAMQKMFRRYRIN